MDSAGILPFTASSVLLGLHRGGWTTLSGKREEGETVKQAAMREFQEETNHLCSALDLCRLCSHRTTVFTSSTPRGFRFALLCVRVDDEGALDPAAFRASHGGEISELRWVRWADVGKLRVRNGLRQDLCDLRRRLRL